MAKRRSWWRAPTHENLQDVHHALRMVAKHPLMSDAERARYTELADDLWEGYFVSPPSKPLAPPVNPSNPPRRGDAVTVSHEPLDPALAVGERDSRNVDRTWRRWKALHLIRNPKTLSRLVGRRVD